MTLQSSLFFEGIFEKNAPKIDFANALEGIFCDEYISACQDFDASKLQDSALFRNVHMARSCALYLLDEQGQIDFSRLKMSIGLLKENLYSLGPQREHDSLANEHMLAMLEQFAVNPDFQVALRGIYLTERNAIVEGLIRETLQIPSNVPLKDGHAKKAAFAALLTHLRQNVGSCFATAPAIMIQKEQPLNFLKDLAELIATGRLIRVVEGVEHAVPLSFSWGAGDLLKPVFVHTLGKNPLETLALSPGLQAAFSAAHLLEKNRGRKEKIEGCLKILEGAKVESLIANPYSVITANQILQQVVQGSLKIGQARNAFKAQTDNALLKAWEFTLASFAESHADFARWNLYISLGVAPEEPGGIGQSLYAVLQEKIQAVNDEIAEISSTYDHLFAQTKYLEGRLSHISSEREAGWLQAEYRMRRQEIHGALAHRDEIYEKGKKLQGLYPLLIDFYGTKIREYFQEVYDAEMHDVTTNPYDDSPAGFRLLYKHGRANPALWTLILSADEYIRDLSSFFSVTEFEIKQLPQFEGLEKEISELITRLIATIQGADFLQSSLVRLAKAYNEPIVSNPLENLTQVKRKPWSYISGGTMATLTSCYWQNAQKPKEVKRWIENENELFAFLIDTLKECPAYVQNKFQKNPEASLLSFSPTHAFLTKPGSKLFKEAWESSLYTYTWIRDYWASQHFKFIDSILLDSRMMDVIVQQLLFFIPSTYRPLVKSKFQSFPYSMPPPEFREHILTTLSYEKWLQGGQILEALGEELDSLLYRFLPLFPEHALEDRLHTIFEGIEIDNQHISSIVESVGRYKMLTAEDLKNYAKALLMLHTKTSRSSTFYHKKIIETMQQTGLCSPEPFLFADTNWVNNAFGFIVNPGTRKLELWRFDFSGSTGRPISQWKHYLNGISKDEWGFYTAPQQYGQ